MHAAGMLPKAPAHGTLAAQRVRRAWWMAAPMLAVLAVVGGSSARV